MKMKNKNVDLLLYFIFISVAIKNRDYFEFPKNLKFVFSLEDINLIEYLIKRKVKNNILEINNKKGYFIYNDDIEYVLSVLKRNRDEYLYNKDDNTYYIYIDDIVRFNDLLNELNDSLKDEFGDNYIFSILNGIWIRMSAGDFDNVYKFLERQISFNESKYFHVPRYFEKEYNEEIYLCDLNNYHVCYRFDSAGAFCESNRKVSIFIQDDVENDSFIKIRFPLPQIYFEIINEDGKKICYIYAIQATKYTIWPSDRKIADSLIDIKKQIRYNYEYILALEFFIKILRENGIYNIKVPLLQLFDYDYHISRSNVYKQKMAILEKAISEGRLTSDDSGYEQTKEVYDKVVDKQDIISKNKTERLIDFFRIVESRFQDIEILSEPFIQDENLIVKILDSPKGKKLKRILM